MLNMTSTTGSCCLALSSVLLGQVSFPGNTTYTSSLESYFSLQEAAVHPDCIVSPQTAQDVSTVVRILTSTHERPGSLSSPTCCQFAIRSGGHAISAGAANIAGGVTIDLSGLSKITLSSVAEGTAPTVSAGVGSTWGAVYDYLDGLGLGVNGGRVAGIGVGGLTLGGGISYFGPRFGWTCDNVVNFEVVLANGTLINANDAENPDLLWALRGGANNFGVVTRVDLQTFPQGDLWGGQVIRPFETAEAQMTALAAFNDPEAYDEFASLITTFAYSGDEDLQFVVNNIEYTKPVANPPIFHSLTSMPALSSTQRITNMSDLAAESASGYPDGFRQATATLTIASSVEAINATVLAWNASIASVRAIQGILWSVNMDPLPPQLYAKYATANSLGLTNRKGRSLIILDMSIRWSDAEDDGAVEEAVAALITNIERDVGELDALDPFLYSNYAAAWQQPIIGYGEDSVERLQRVQSVYDPERVFTVLVPGGFKISDGLK